MSLASRVADFVRQQALKRSTGLVAVSSGPDSVALAHALHSHLLSGELERLVLVHVNHLLRGSESDEDERWVLEMAQDWPGAKAEKLSARSARIDAAEQAKQGGDNLENAARKLRYAWFAQVAREEQAAWVAVGHTADDQAETVLFRLLRGAGIHGLAGMSDSRPLAPGVQVVRPLLSVRRGEVLAYLREHGLSYRVDSSNLDERFTRNRLRAELLPLLQHRYNPRIVETLMRLAEQARDLDADLQRHALELLAHAELPRAGDTLVFSLERLQPCSANEIAEMFRRVWSREGWPAAAMDFVAWRRLADLAHGGATAWDFPGPIHAVRRERVLQLTPARPSAMAEHSLSWDE